MPDHEKTADDEQAIRNLAKTWMDASAAGDHAAVLQLMADDVVFLLPGQPPMRKADFVAGQKQQTFDIAGESDIQEVRVFGDWAYCWSNLTVTITPRDGSAAITQKGPVLSVLHKQQGGRWVIKRDANMLSLAT